MWPFCKRIVEYVVYDYLLTYMDNTTESIQANEYNWSEHDIVFRKEGIGVFWTRACLVKKIENRGKVTPEVNVK